MSNAASATTIPAPVVVEQDQNPVVTDTPVIVSSPIVDPNPAPVNDAVIDPAVPVVTDSNADPVNPAEPTGSTTPEWLQRRINKEVGRRYEADRIAQDAVDRAKAAEDRMAELLARNAGKDSIADPAKPTVAVTEEEIERRASEKAIRIAQANEFNKACNNIVDAGKKEFKDSWDQAIKNLTLVGAIGDKVSPEFLETAIELKNPAQILHHLGSNMEEAERITQLPPKKMAMELARIEAQLNAPKPVVVAPVAPVSQAPAPVIPVGGKAAPGAPSLDDPNISPDDWYDLRAKQIQERKNRYRRV